MDINNEIEFRSWMVLRNKPKTVSDYVSKLINLEEIVRTHFNCPNYVLLKPVFEVNDLEEFNGLVGEFENKSGYSELNRNYQHSIISAALNKYRGFLLAQEAALTDWYPSLEEYNPGISKEQWFEYLNNKDLFGPVWLGFLAKYYDNNGQGTCTEMARKYGKTKNYYSRTSIEISKHLHDKTGCKLNVGNDGKEVFFTLLFRYKQAENDVQGTSTWALRPELYNALTEFEIWNYLPEGGEASMTVKQTLNEIKDYIAAKGFTYDGDLIENFYLSLKSKPFVILAGTSGTGKTKLAEYFAEAVGAESKLVSVRPDWSDSSDLFGHVNLKGEFTKGAIIDFIKKASEHKGKPYFLIFDEMNLARVEYYMSDFLSVLETRRRSSGSRNDEIVSKPLFNDDVFGNDANSKGIYSGLSIPENLYIVGTVNMDETTFPFSKKVLDRANTIEFSFVDLSPAFEDDTKAEQPAPLQNDFLKQEFIHLQECSDYKEIVQKTCDELIRINDKLKDADLHVGYRIRDDFCFYMINREKADVLSFDEAFDNQIMQKILPRIQGSSSSVKKVIQELFVICAGDYSGYSDNGSINESMKRFVDDKRDNCRFKKSAEKLVYMMRRYEEDGFTSYWL